MGQALDTNQTIGEYRIVDFVGVGGMGEVYRAMHSKIGRVAAVKVLTLATQSSGFVERFFNEARIQASLQHPNIATLYDFCEVAGRPCIIMEYVDGQTVSERVAAYGALPLTEAAYVFERVVEAIEYIHCHGVIHRDIKSNNIKISSQGQVKLLDFGIAKAQTSPGLTQIGSVIGTLQYLAPELIRGGTADARGDIWAMGVLLYEMVTGRVPFHADTVGDLCDQIDRVNYAPPAQLNPAVPREFAHIISRCLRKNPSERYSTARELLADVKRLTATVPEPALSERVSEAANEYVEAKAGGGPSKTPLFIGAAVAALVLLVFGVAALIYFTSSSGPAVADESVKTGLASAPSPGASREAQKRVFEIKLMHPPDRADIYDGDQKIAADVPGYSYPVKLGQRVKLTVKSEGYEDYHREFTVTELTKSESVAMEKKK